MLCSHYFQVIRRKESIVKETLKLQSRAWDNQLKVFPYCISTLINTLLERQYFNIDDLYVLIQVVTMLEWETALGIVTNVNKDGEIAKRVNNIIFS